MIFSKKILSLTINLALTASVLTPALVNAHGYISYPLTRNMKCKEQGGFWGGTPPTEGCKAYKDTGQWQTPFTDEGGSLGTGWLDYPNSIADGKVCSANYTALNSVVKKGDWPTTAIKPNSDGAIDLAYKYTAYHGTDHIAFYITKHPYDPTKPLKWSDFELLGKRSGANTPDGSGQTYFKFKLPSHQVGRHVIFAAWPVSAQHGTKEVFTTCADVIIEGNVTAPSWETVGEGLKATQNIKAKTTIRFRLFDVKREGSVAFETHFTTDADMTDKAWLHKLAQKINADTSLIKVGTLKDGEVVLTQPEKYYDVFTKNNKQYSYAIYVEPVDDGDNSEEVTQKPIITLEKDHISVSAKPYNEGYPMKITHSEHVTSLKWEVLSQDKAFAIQKVQAGPTFRVVEGKVGEGLEQVRAWIAKEKVGTAKYRVTATGKGGSVTKDITVEVKAADNGGETAPSKPVVNVENAHIVVTTTGSQQTHPLRITHVQNATALKWEALSSSFYLRKSENGPDVSTINGPATGTANDNVFASIPANKTGTAKYRVTATGKGGSAAREITVEVKAANEGGNTPNPGVPAFKRGTEYKVGDRVTYKGQIYRCLQAHTGQDHWAPDAAVSLWTRSY